MNLPTAPAIPIYNINLGLSKFIAATNNDAPAMESPKTRNRFGVGSKYFFNFTFLIL